MQGRLVLDAGDGSGRRSSEAPVTTQPRQGSLGELVGVSPKRLSSSTRQAVWARCTSPFTVSRQRPACGVPTRRMQSRTRKPPYFTLRNKALNLCLPGTVPPSAWNWSRKEASPLFALGVKCHASWTDDRCTRSSNIPNSLSIACEPLCRHKTKEVSRARDEQFSAPTHTYTHAQTKRERSAHRQ